MKVFKIIKNIFQKVYGFIKNIITVLVGFVQSIFYTLFDFITSVLVVIYSLFAMCLFLGFNVSLTSVFIVVVVVFLLDICRERSKLAYLKYLKKPLGGSFANLVKQIAEEQGMPAPNVYDSDEENYQDLSSKSINAFAWFDIIILDLNHPEVNDQMKAFVIGHEMAHIKKKHWISCHLNMRLRTVETFFKSLFQFNLKNLVIWALIAPLVYYYYDGNIINIINIIPAYLSLVVGKIIIRWMDRQKEYSCDVFALDCIPKSRDKLLSGGVQLFEFLSQDTIKPSFYDRTLGVIFHTHPLNSSRINKLNTRYNSYYNDISKTLLRYIATLIGVSLVVITMEELGINIFTHPKAIQFYNSALLETLRIFL